MAKYVKNRDLVDIKKLSIGLITKDLFEAEVATFCHVQGICGAYKLIQKANAKCIWEALHGQTPFYV